MPTGTGCWYHFTVTVAFVSASRFTVLLYDDIGFGVLADGDEPTAQEPRKVAPGQPTAFRALVQGYENECPCCQRSFLVAK